MAFYLLFLMVSSVYVISVESASQEIDTSCSAYRKLAETDSSKSTGPQPSKVVTINSKAGSNGPFGGSSMIQIETPSAAIWIPKCETGDFQNMPNLPAYLSLQKRQLNNEQFCVIPRSGAIVFDPAKNLPKGGKLPTKIYCECNVYKNVFHGAHGRGLKGPDCDPIDGSYKPLQQYPDGACSCFSKDGKLRSSDYKCDKKDPCTNAVLV
ncbi:hypothetical protein BV898_00554 [Hypsibius exemplaris]|uniref:Thyroglobulin type-1 domain-containing protein n=1 Tax=Hypsibius exemplaris TaxID=2072580 RepID=A0A1W0XDY2_HYPEX|nr:hypothetical protein BV898_00554 [Hypsibius exemplaris]